MESSHVAAGVGGQIAATAAELLAAAEAGDVPSGPAHAVLGGLCMADDDFEGARGHWELAFRELRGAGDLRRAARVAADLRGGWSAAPALSRAQMGVADGAFPRCAVVRVSRTPP